MRPSFVLIGLPVVALLIAPLHFIALAQEDKPDLDSCRVVVDGLLGKEQREFRATLFGQPKAEDSAVGSVRYDTDHVPWYKIGENQWQSTHPDNDGLTWGDVLIDSFAEFEDKKGIFETKRTLTSELIPYTTQSLRVLQCRLDVLCARVKESPKFTEEEDPQDITINATACEEFEGLTIPECHVRKDGGVNVALAVDIDTYCNAIATDILAKEADMLKMTIEYDAAYRSILQFGGDFDLFLEQMRWPMSNTIRQSAYIIGNLSRIPCFLASCDDLPEEATARP